MRPLRNSLIKQIGRYQEDDDAFLGEVERLVEAFGEEVFQVLLNILTQLEFQSGEAHEIWDSVLQHRKDMSAALGRPVKLQTAVCDYFLTVRKSFQNPKVVELQLFEDAHFNSKCDPLTGLFNRSYFTEALSGEISRSKRHSTEFSLLFLDIDNFKEINDEIGHVAGDRVLEFIADLIRSEKRGEDIAVRYGGEELILLLPGTSKPNALIKAERIRHKIEKHKFQFKDREFQVTVSGGIASYPMDSRTGLELVDSADRAMYRAKSAGKNRIELFSSDKRQYVRVDFAGPVQFRQLGNVASNQHFSGKSKDLSLSGILFESKEPIEIGARIQMEIPIPDPSNPILVVGTVMRVEAFQGSYDIGISFIQMEAKEQGEITRYFQNMLNPDPFSH